MPKFFADRFPQGFFDLPRSAGETLPLDVIAAWTSSDQTRDEARRILDQHLLPAWTSIDQVLLEAREILHPPLLHRALLSSVSAGLPSLGRERPLIEIL